VNNLPLTYLGNTMTLKLLNYLFYFLGQTFGISYSMLQINIINWYTTCYWKKIVRFIICFLFSFATSQLQAYANDKISGEILVVSYLRYMVNGFVIYGPIAVAF
jgi:hypothetical protein